METQPLLRKSSSAHSEAGSNYGDRHEVSSTFTMTMIALVLLLIVSLGTYEHFFNGKHSSFPSPFPTVSHPLKPSALWGKVSKPYPTGAFWTNLAIDKGEDPVGVLPYGVKCTERGVEVSYGASRRHTTQISIFDDFLADLTLTSIESYVSRSIQAFDFASVTMGFATATGGGFKTPLVKGSPFITVVYSKTTPVISSELMHFVSVDQKQVAEEGKGTQYVLTLGNWQKWLLYCSENVEFTKSGDKMVASRPITGFVRVAFLPIQSPNAFSTLMNFVNKYPTGASLSFSFPPASHTGVVEYRYRTQGTGRLLMLSLPHHREVLTFPSQSDEEDESSEEVDSSLSPYLCIKGQMKAVIGEVWKLTYPLPKIGFSYEDIGGSSSLSPEKMQTVNESLLEDLKIIPGSFGDPYQFGKEIARTARLALIAKEMNQIEALEIALASLRRALTAWLTGKNDDPVVYDTTYGGVVPSNGLKDKYADYGAGWYSDHHFHYGYLIYAAAVALKLDPPFAKSFAPHFSAFVRDICTLEESDGSFPFARHKDFYDGHSWASGLFSQANGKGQESSSEAVNAYYAVYLYAMESKQKHLMNFAHLLLAMEIQATKKYWHMPRDNEIYDSVFAASKMIGNLGAFDVTATTWFGFELEFVHGINIMPVTPATALVLDPQYVSEEWPVVGHTIPTPEEEAAARSNAACSANKACSTMGLGGDCCPAPSGVYLGCCDPRPGGTRPMQNDWRSLLYADLAVIDREEAWDRLEEMKSYGSGGSRANFLLWAATRSPPSGADKTTFAVNYTLAIEPQCDKNSACMALGLPGSCCPTSSGVMLGCCPTVVPPPSESST